ncbi:hypothetical protein C8R44DRAFT_546031, partial [Mycena epipterygia]
EMSISVKTQYFAGRDASEAAMVVEITVLQGSYMIWAGTTAVGEDEKGQAVEGGRLARDWAVAMPPGVVGGG